MVPLGEANAGELLKTAVSDTGLMTIHTEEASLEDIFVALVAKPLTRECDASAPRSVT